MTVSFARRLSAGFLAIACAGLSAGAANAETLPVAGIYPAGNDAAASVNSIAIENFGGDKGSSLSFAISDALEGAVLYGEPYFQIFASDDGNADAILRGEANGEAVETELDDRKVTKCEKKDKDKKCIKEKVTYYACSRLDVRLYPQIRLIGADGREIYRKRDSLSASEDYCADDSSTPSIEEMLDGMVNSFARTVRYDLAPVYRNQDIRVLESRKGMTGDAKNAFRSAVKLTKTDIKASCDGFRALESSDPEHVSVLFNIGLCAEGEGELDLAADYYRRTLAAEPGKDYAESGLRRIGRRERANTQLDAHYGPELEDGAAEVGSPNS
ncbi:hypothetical protein [Pontixanthobacter sp. CEM42]|uniref:hypothetical protein n=1 Tax=Pontixanthobacter sp. CEM42 TaxID=2792077 RepID=UPI001AE0C478|nr:hypothetical protein [Pontixanthobacter sp. CEM42]